MLAVYRRSVRCFVSKLSSAECHFVRQFASNPAPAEHDAFTEEQARPYPKSVPGVHKTRCDTDIHVNQFRLI